MSIEGTMTIAAEVAIAIDEDLRNLQDPRVRVSIEAFRLPTPRQIRLAWDYGQPGETFDGWLVLEDQGQRTGIVYCENGFGPASSWGLITTGEACPSMGMDSGWFRRFIEAYLDSFSATDLPIWTVVRWRKGNSSRDHITKELPWEEAWSLVGSFRDQDPGHLYGCEHNIVY